MRTPEEIIESVVNTYVERRGVDRQELTLPLAMIKSIKADETAANADEHLSDAGKRYRREQAIAKAEERDLPSFEGGTARLIIQWEDEEEKIVRGPARELSTEDRTLIWSFLAAKSAHQQREEYLAAIVNDDWKTEKTIESLAPSMSPLDDETRRRARERKLAKASAAQREAIEHLKNRIVAREHVALTARQLLKEMAAADVTVGGRR